MSKIEVKKLEKSFDGVKVINKLDMTIEEGQITGFVGPNGSGKSTLVNLLTGMTSIDAGSVSP